MLDHLLLVKTWSNLTTREAGKCSLYRNGPILSYESIVMEVEQDIEGQLAVSTTPHFIDGETKAQSG